MKLPRVVIAAVVWLLVIEALPGPAAWSALAIVVVGTVAGVVAEPVIIRLVWCARRPSTPLAVPGDPAGPRPGHRSTDRRHRAGRTPPPRRPGDRDRTE